MKRLLIFTLVLALLLCGCGKPAEPTETTSVPTTETAAPTTEPTTAPTTEPTTAPTTEPTTVPTTTELILPYQHPLTGVALAEPMENRPLAVVINNVSAAQPLYGIGYTDVLYEIITEGGGTITRMLGIFTDLENTPIIGPVRSARTYFIDLARAYSAPLIHCGGSEYALNELNSSRYPSIDERFNGKYFYRDMERDAAGYAWEHTLFTTGEQLIQGTEAKGMTMTYEGGKDYGYSFIEELQLGGDPAEKLTLSFYEHGKKTVMTYDEASGGYTGQQIWKSKDGILSDTNTGEPAVFENVLVLFARTTTDGYRVFAELTGQGEGYFACNGTVVPITWHRDGLTDPFYYTLADGTVLPLSVGRTYVGILPKGSPLTIE